MAPLFSSVFIVQAQGYKTKSPSLKEVITKSEVRAAKLIGYDETPSTGTAKSGGIEDSGSDDVAQDYQVRNISTLKSKPISRPTEPLSHHKSPEVCVTQPPSSSFRSDLPAAKSSNGSNSNGKGGPTNVSAKSRLYELCTANCWRPPIFECCQEVGPSHLKEFLFKVMLEMEEMPNESFEFYGEVRARKKDAAETAADAALWYLENEGYRWDRNRDK